MMLQDKMLQDFTGSSQLDQMCFYHLSSGGKCLRGQLALTQGMELGLSENQVLSWALACEFLHNATLIHDDIQDNDPIRRGQTSLWKKYGVAQAINVGDYFIFRSFALTSQLNNSELNSLLAKTAEDLVKGQVLEIGTVDKCQNSLWDHYQTMAHHKTGTLFQLPIAGSHLIANQPMRDDIESCWKNLGLSYQIYDDIKDFMGLKQPGQKQKDFVEGRINSIIALLSTDKTNQLIIDRYLDCSQSADQKVGTILELNQRIVEQEIINRLEEKVQSYLVNFRSRISPPCQKIILTYLDSLTTQRTPHEARSIQ